MLTFLYYYYYLHLCKKYKHWKTINTTIQTLTKCRKEPSAKKKKKKKEKNEKNQVQKNYSHSTTDRSIICTVYYLYLLCAQILMGLLLIATCLVCPAHIDIFLLQCFTCIWSATMMMRWSIPKWLLSVLWQCGIIASTVETYRCESV